MTTTTRRGIVLPQGGDLDAVPADLARIVGVLDPADPAALSMVLLRQGHGAPTGATVSGVWYEDIDSGVIYKPAGTAWRAVNPAVAVADVTGLPAALSALQQADTTEAQTRAAGVTSALNAASSASAAVTAETSRAQGAEQQALTAASSAQTTANAAQPLTGKDTNGGYVGRDSNGGVSLPGTLTTGRHVVVSGNAAGLVNVSSQVSGSSVAGNDVRGIVTITVGAAGVAAGTKLFDIAFNNLYTTAPAVVVSPAGNINPATFVTGFSTTASFPLFAQTALVANGFYQVAYVVIG